MLGMNVLVRYGRIPEVARFAAEQPWQRGDAVVVETHRGLLVGEVLGPDRRRVGDPPPEGQVVGPATRSADAPDDEAFLKWTERIAEWEIDVELIDLEVSVDGEKTTLYVLNGRDAEPTRLALQAAAAGLGVIDVQPVTAEGVAPPQPGGSGCGSCGCH